jgi:LPXTG-motif cell wall-anchored protein
MNQRMMASMVVVLVALLALPLMVHGQEPDPVQLMRDCIAAQEAGDVDGSLEYLSDDIVMNLIPAPPGGKGVYTGKEEMRLRLEETIASNPHSEIWDCETTGIRTTCAASTEDDFTRSLGLDPLLFTLEFDTVDGLFTSITWTITDESLATLLAAVAALPQTGGGAFPLQVVMVGLGGLAIAGGLGLRRLRRRSL